MLGCVAPSVLTFVTQETYTYVKNLQGDVIRILDSDGNAVVKYTYDPWGVPTVYGDSELAAINPCSYRGYYYDEETGYYYLQSRYYDPVIGRFLNSDDASLLGAKGTLPGFNLFAYCDNNAVNNLDPTGFYYIKLSTLAYYFVTFVGFNPIGATLIAIGLYKAKVWVTGKLAILGAKLGSFWGPVASGLLSTVFALLGFTVGSDIVEALWDCAWQGKQGIEFTVKKNRWGWPYAIDIYAK